MQAGAARDGCRERHWAEEAVPGAHSRGRRQFRRTFKPAFPARSLPFPPIPKKGSFWHPSPSKKGVVGVEKVMLAGGCDPSVSSPAPLPESDLASLILSLQGFHCVTRASPRPLGQDLKISLAPSSLWPGSSHLLISHMFAGTCVPGLAVTLLFTVFLFF